MNVKRSILTAWIVCGVGTWDTHTLFSPRPNNKASPFLPYTHRSAKSQSRLIRKEAGSGCSSVRMNSFHSPFGTTPCAL